jgi:hypothetical protein
MRDKHFIAKFTIDFFFLDEVVTLMFGQFDVGGKHNGA